MFRLITTVRRGTASDLAAAWARYPSIEAARAGASALMREDRVLRVMVMPGTTSRARSLSGPTGSPASRAGTSKESVVGNPFRGWAMRC